MLCAGQRCLWWRTRCHNWSDCRRSSCCSVQASSTGFCRAVWSSANPGLRRDGWYIHSLTRPKGYNALCQRRIIYTLHCVWFFAVVKDCCWCAIIIPPRCLHCLLVQPCTLIKLISGTTQVPTFYIWFPVQATMGSSIIFHIPTMYINHRQQIHCPLYHQLAAMVNESVWPRDR